MKTLLEQLIDRWEFTRGETREVLQSLHDDQLMFRPEGDKWQPLYYQFNCAARSQLVYTKAVQEGRMDFGWFGSKDLPGKDEATSGETIGKFLDTADALWLAALNRAGSAEAVIKWPDGDKALAIHIASLMEHERMHLGQLISYFTLAGYELPAGFRRNWAL